MQYIIRNRNSNSKISGVSVLAIAAICVALSISLFMITPAQADPIQMFSDDFESGVIDPIKWNMVDSPVITDDPVYVYEGTYAVLFDGGANPDDQLISTTIDTTGYENVVFSYARMTESLEPDEENYFFIEYSTDDGETWTIVEQLTEDNQWSVHSELLPAEAYDNPDMMIRFRITGGAENDRAAIDLISITGDNNPPTTDPYPPEVGTPNVITECGGVEYVMINCSTPMWINVSDNMDQGGIGAYKIHYSVWWNPTEPGTYTKIPGSDVTIYDQGSGDLDERLGYISIEITYDEGCFHEVRWDVEDYVGNIAYFDYDFAVDCTPPELIKYVGEPEYFENCPYVSWVSCETPFMFNATDLGCNGGAGVARIGYEIRVQNTSTVPPHWTIVKTGVVEDDGDGDLWGDVFGEIQHIITMDEECVHEVAFWAEDYLGNRVDQKQKHLVDCTPPTTEKTVEGPYCGSDYFWVTPDTEFTLTATDYGCEGGVGVWYLHYELWWDSDADGIVDMLLESQDLYDTNQVTFSFEEDCLHEIRWYAVDYLGNTEEEHVQQHRVDSQPPETIKTFDGPTYDDPVYGEDYWLRDHDTYVILDAIDTIEPCAVGVEYIHVELWWDSNHDDVIDTMLWEEEITDDYYEFQIMEDCLHEIRWYAVDCLGNTEEEHVQQHRVDSQPPETIKTFDGPTCDDLEMGENFWVTTSTVITLTATDTMNPCAVGVDYIYYEIWWDEDDNGEFVLVDSQTVHDDTVSFSFTEECLHEIRWYAVDLLGNVEEMHYQLHRVDDTPPEIIKIVGDPHCMIIEEEYCVTTNTIITVDAIDQTAPCAVGLVSLEYRIWQMDEGWSDWMPYYEGISFDEECMHKLEIRAMDCLGNSATDLEIFYVDNTAPEIIKTVGEPNCMIMEDEYCVTTSTPITVVATEMGCCPCDDVIIDYRIMTDGEWDPWMPYSEAIYFTEECEHELQIRAMDCLGNTAIDHEVFYVDDTAPEIIKTVGDPHCMIEEDVYCVNLSTPITVVATEMGCCPCTDVTLEYRIKTNGIWSEWMPYTGAIYFTEECEHQLEIRAWDCLGNMATDLETFYVDETPPEIFKTVGDPHCVIIEGEEYCVTTETPITVEVTNGGCCPCQDITVEYRIWSVDGWSEWMPYVGAIYFAEECDHQLEIRAMDCLGNTATDLETFHVDNTAPEIIKTVGDPHCMIEEDVYCVNLSTPITVVATEMGCCPCTDVTLEYRIKTNGIWSEWMPYTGAIYFTEECEHQLEIRAWDCLGNMATDLETFYVDETPPEIFKTVGDPHCVIIEGEEYCVTTETPITVEVTNGGCCPCQDITVEYRIMTDGEWGPWMPYSEAIYFTEECEHELQIRAMDCLGNTAIDHEVFYVDDTAPEIIKEISEPYCDDCLPEGDYCVNTSTEITISAEERGCCPCDEVTLLYRTWYQGEWTEWMTYEEAISFDEECTHYLEIKAMDCLGNYVIDNETFYVDETPPELEKTVGQPNFYLGLDEFGHDVWLIYPGTPITFTAEDLGCCPCTDSTIMYRYWYLGQWTDWMEYTEEIHFSQGCIHYLEAYAMDCLGNMGDIDNETFWVCAPGGDPDEDPIIDIIEPEDGATICDQTVEVLMHAEDDQTSWENLNVFLKVIEQVSGTTMIYAAEQTDTEGYFSVPVDIYKYNYGTHLIFEAMVIDEDGNDDTSPPLIINVCSTTQYDQWLDTGWNQFSTNYVGCDESIERVFESIVGCYDLIAHYDQQAGEWISYWIDAPENELTTIQSGKQYWVHITCPQPVHWYIAAPEISIDHPENGSIITELPSVYGTTWDSQNGVQNVYLQISYMEDSTIYYWDDSVMEWTTTETYLMADLTTGYHQEWSYDSSQINWIYGMEYTITAMAEDSYGCHGYDAVTFTYEGVTYETSFDFDKWVWRDSMEWWDEYTEDEGYEDTVRFNITLENTGDTTLEDATLVDHLPEGLDYIEESTMVKAIIDDTVLEYSGAEVEPTITPGDGEMLLTWVEETMYNLPPGGIVHLEFEAMVSVMDGDLTNTAMITIIDELEDEYQDDDGASVWVYTECPPPLVPQSPGPEDEETGVPFGQPLYLSFETGHDYGNDILITIFVDDDDDPMTDPLHVHAMDPNETNGGYKLIYAETTFDPEPNTMYYWQVQVMADCEATVYSPVWSFTTAECEVTAAITSPAQGERVPTDSGLEITGTASSDCSCIPSENIQIYVFYNFEGSTYYYDKSTNTWEAGTVIWNTAEIQTGGCPDSSATWSFTIDSELTTDEEYVTRVKVTDQIGNEYQTPQTQFTAGLIQ